MENFAYEVEVTNKMKEEAEKIINYYGAFVEDAVADKEFSIKKQEEVTIWQPHLSLSWKKENNS
jgi:hypothetical protein